MGADTKGPRPIGREVPAPGSGARRWTGDNRRARRGPHDRVIHFDGEGDGVFVLDLQRRAPFARSAADVRVDVLGPESGDAHIQRAEVARQRFDELRPRGVFRQIDLLRSRLALNHGVHGFG